jgi:hypothetical protein
MKAILSTFLDYKQASLETQIDLFNKLNLSHYMLRRIDGKAIYEMTLDELDLIYPQFEKIRVLAVDPLLPSFHMDQIDGVDLYNQLLEDTVTRVKKFNASYYVYTIPVFDETINDYKQIVEVVTEHIKIIRKHKLKVFIKFSDKHTPKMYRYILDELRNKHVEIIFDYTYLYKINEAEVTAYRILRDYIGMLIMEDIDKTGAGRVIGSGEHIPVAQIAKRFIKKSFEGYIVLDSSLVELLGTTKEQGWFSKLVSKKTKHELKIYNDFIERYTSTDTYRVLVVQMAVLSLMFLNKKIALG